ncbi:hypothetical protein DY000_02009992 [Brassica cretica]|uniref:ATPase V1 complex subunit H C-terminal domain-containing protein n=1 Tax=Brassica cretica TaxID=69181 RepID=A0ABQ7C8T4_BRACR|nr:hypothetical protein DY000_02009992 [Brassica cretica]
MSTSVGIRTSSIDQAELSTEQVLQRDIPWVTYMTTKLISATDLQLLRRYDKKPENARAQLLDEDGRAYVQLFVTILRDIFKEETVEYVLALIYKMLSANPARARLFQDQSLAHEDTYEPFLSAKSKRYALFQVAVEGQLVHSRKKLQDPCLDNKLRQPSHPTRGAPVAISCLSTLLKEPVLLYKTCLCIWLLSYYEPAIEYLATSRTMQRLTEVVKSSTKEKVVRVVILTFRNLLPKGTFGAQMVDLGLPHIIHSLKTQAWSDEYLLGALIQLEECLKDKIRKLSSFDKYKQEVLLGHLDWNPMHKKANFWRENILRVLLTILDTSSDPRSLAVVCYDLSQFIQYHAAGRVIVTDLKAKERVMKLMAH